MSASPDTRPTLVVNADDLGVSCGATLGILRAHRDGIVTSASLAATTPFYRDALESCVRTSPALGIGLHFTLTSGRPVSPPAKVPLLVDRDGVLRWRFVSLLRAAGIARRADLLEQIEVELEAQIARLKADGVEPDHIDGERHVHLIPGIFERVVAAARRHNVPFVRAGREIAVRPMSRAATLSVLGPGLAKSLILGAMTRRNRRLLGGGVRSADHFASYLYSGRLDAVMRGVLTNGSAAALGATSAADGAHPGITEIMVHPGVPEESRGIDLGNRDVEHYLVSPDRESEMEACIEARQWTSGWRLATFGELGREHASA